MTSNNNNNGKRYPESITGLYPPYGGDLEATNLEVKVSPAVFDKLQKVKVGGKLYLKRAKELKDGKPVAFIEYRSPEEMDELRARMQKEKEDSL